MEYLVKRHSSYNIMPNVDIYICLLMNHNIFLQDQITASHKKKLAGWRIENIVQNVVLPLFEL